MIFGANKQNKNLRDSGSRPKDTSPRKELANKYSAKIASDRGNATNKTAAEAKTTAQSSKKNTIRSNNSRGSKEGLVNAHSAHIQVNDRGYLSKSIQKARYNKSSPIQPQNSNRDNFTNLNSRGIVNNYSGITQEKTSSSRLNAISKLNKM